VTTEPRDSGVDVTVVVPSHRRERRLRTLLDALAEQTLPRGRWEVVVAHTYQPEVAAPLFDEHELTAAGVLRPLAVDPGRAGAARQRNAGWRAGRGSLVAFTDDDCRPTPDWLERLLEAHDEPGDIVQGATDPDPREEHLLHVEPHVRALRVVPPDRFAQTCNILYERELVERLGGFDEEFVVGEDVDLFLRAQDVGARLVPAPEAVTYHAVDALSTLQKIRSQHQWQHLALLVKKQPRLRQYCEWGLWYKPEHSRAVLAAIALAAARRRPWMLAGVVPYVALERWRHGPRKRSQLRSLREMPAHFVVELAEVGSFAIGSWRYRTLVL
jgi:GT2 family glycosyltransferase